MDEPINVGDLVMLVRGHECLMARHGGLIFRVAQLVPQRGGGWKCPKCGERDIGKNDAWGAHWTMEDKGIPLSWLKRIPPLDELDDVQRDEEITA